MNTEAGPMPEASETSPAPRLKRVLGLWDLIVYGMIIIQIVAPVPIFGLLEERSRGHSVTTILIAMIAMMLTAVSYGRMAVLYPMSGSAYTYVARSLSPYLGFLVGWAMFLDYLIIPLISAIIPALAVQRLIPSIPFAVLTLIIVAAMTVLNLRGIRTTARANVMLLVVTTIVVAAFMVLAVHYLFLKARWSGVFSMKPMYNPATFRAGSILSALSLAALSYIGFDGVTTLAEETIDPKRIVVLATVLVCFITGVLSAAELYLFHQIIPDCNLYTNLNTAYLDVMKVVGGPVLFTIFSIVMSVSQFGSGFTGQVSAARLIYGMGRDDFIPRRLFARLSPRNQSPTWNIMMVGVLAFVGTLLIPFGDACDLLNFGALLGFMGVNSSAFASYYLHPPEGHRRHFLWDAFCPAAGLLLCFMFWIDLPNMAKIAGGAWLLTGIIYCALRTKGFRERPTLFEFKDNQL